MDDHQRSMWLAMISVAAQYRKGQLDLRKLVDDLRGLYAEADPHDPNTRSDFEEAWGRIDMELELRTEPWAPAGSASDEALGRALDDFEEWVRRVLQDPSSDHN